MTTGSDDAARPSHRQVRAMIREPNTFFPLKKDLGTGPVEIVLGNVLDRVIYCSLSVERSGLRDDPMGVVCSC